MDPLFVAHSGKLFMEKYQEILDREIAEKGYFAQEDYDSLTARFTAMVLEAAQPAIRFGAYCGALHYNDPKSGHQLDVTAEKEQLELEVSDESKEVAKSRDWWNG